MYSAGLQFSVISQFLSFSFAEGAEASLDIDFPTQALVTLTIWNVHVRQKKIFLHHRVLSAVGSCHCVDSAVLAVVTLVMIVAVAMESESPNTTHPTFPTLPNSTNTTLPTSRVLYLLDNYELISGAGTFQLVEPVYRIIMAKQNEITRNHKRPYSEHRQVSSIHLSADLRDANTKPPFHLRSLSPGCQHSSRKCRLLRGRQPAPTSRA